MKYRSQMTRFDRGNPICGLSRALANDLSGFKLEPDFRYKFILAEAALEQAWIDLTGDLNDCKEGIRFASNSISTQQLFKV